MPFFQDATIGQISGGNFEDRQTNYNNHYNDRSINYGGTSNRAAYAPNYSTQDNRRVGEVYSSLNTQAEYVPGTQGHAAGSAAPQNGVPLPSIQDQIGQAYYALSFVADLFEQTATTVPQGSDDLTSAAQLCRLAAKCIGIPQGFNNSNVPQHLGDSPILNQANQPYGFNSHNQLQSPPPRSHEQQVPHNPQRALSLPQQPFPSTQPYYQGHNTPYPALHLDLSAHQTPQYLPELSAPAGGLQPTGLHAGQVSGLPRFEASVVQQSQLQQLQHSSASTSLPQPQPQNSTHPLNHATQAALLQHPPFSSYTPQRTSPTPTPTDVSHVSSLAASASTSSGPPGGISSVEGDPAQPAALTLSNAGHTFASASVMAAQTHSTTSGASTIPNVVVSPPALPPQAAPPFFAHGNPTAQPVPVSTPPSHAPATSPVVPNPPVPSNSLVGITTSPSAPIIRPAGNSLPTTSQNEPAANKRAGASLLAKARSLVRKKQK